MNAVYSWAEIIAIVLLFNVCFSTSYRRTETQVRLPLPNLKALVSQGTLNTLKHPRKARSLVYVQHRRPDLCCLPPLLLHCDMKPQVCALCGGSVNNTAVDLFCSSSAGRIKGRCCLKNNSISDPERIIG